MQNGSIEIGEIDDEIDEYTNIVKVVDKKVGAVAGGEIEIYSDKDCTKLISLIKITNADGEKIMLPAGNYYVVMTKPPAGYNQVEEVLEFSSVEGQDNIWEITVDTGSELPSTGSSISTSIGDGEITITQEDGANLEGYTVFCYHVGTFDENDEIVLTGDFVATGIEIEGNYDELKSLAKQLAEYAKIERVNGIAKVMNPATFSGLEYGVYLFTFEAPKDNTSPEPPEPTKPTMPTVPTTSTSLIAQDETTTTEVPEPFFVFLRSV